MAKFKVGDRARVKYIRESNDYSWVEGAEVVIVELLSNNPYDLYVYDCRVAVVDSGYYAYPIFDQLEPIIDLGSWDELQKTINWNPTKEVSHHD